MSPLSRFTQTGLVVVMLAFFVYVLWASQGFRDAARIFPTTIAVAGILMALGELARQLLTRFRPEEADITDLGDDASMDIRAHFVTSGKLLAWLIGFVALVFTVGLIPATVVFVFAMMRLQFATPLWPSVLVTAGVLAVVLTLSRVLLLRWPQPLIPIPGL